MNELLSQIGIVVWGCKGGCHVFCDNKVVDVLTPEIDQTLKDIRSFITISRPGIDFYALEFTSKHKVYTQYRSSNDSGNGAFIAITLYFPHKAKAMNVRSLLNEMMNDYFKEYMNPLSYSPLSGKYDDINKYVAILKLHETEIVPDKSHEYHAASAQDDRPKLYRYEKIEEVDKYFGSPYRQEFFECQEVQFLSAEIVDNLKKYEVNFLITPDYITKVSDPIPESVLFPLDNRASFKVDKLVINGEDKTGATTKVPLTREDVVTVTVSAVNHESAKWQDVSVDTLIEQGLIRKNKRDFEFVSSFTLRPKRFFFRIVNRRGVDVKKLVDHLCITSPIIKFKTLEKNQTGQYGFMLSGNEIENLCKLEYSIDEVESFAGARRGFIVLTQFVPKTILANPELSISIEEHELNFKFPDDKPSSIELYVQGPNCPNAIALNPIKLGLLSNSHTLYMPSDLSVTANVKNYVVVESGGYYVVTPKFKTVTLKLKGKLGDSLNNLAIRYCSSTGVETLGKKSGKECTFELPYKWRDTIGSVLIDTKRFPIKVVDNDDKISLIASLVCNSTDSVVSIHYEIYEDNSFVKGDASVEEKGYMLLPKNSEITLSEDITGFRLKDLGLEGEVMVYLIEKKYVASTSLDGGQQGRDVPHVDGGSATGSGNETTDNLTPTPVQPEELKCTLKFFGCAKLFAKIYNKKSGKKEFKNLKTFPSLPVSSSEFKIYDAKEREICAIAFPRSAYYEDQEIDADNRANGFIVEWSSEEVCSVTYKPLDVFSRLEGFISKKMLLVLAAVLLIAGLGTAAFFWFGDMGKSSKLTILFKSEDKYSSINLIKTDLPTVSIKENELSFSKDKNASIKEYNATIFFSYSESGKTDEVAYDFSQSQEELINVYVRGQAKNDTTIVVPIKSPGQKSMEVLGNNNFPLADCENIISQYPHYKSLVDTIVCSIWDNASDKKKFFDEINSKNGLSKLPNIQFRLSEYSTSESERLAQETQKKILDDQIKKIEYNLALITCTEADVDNLQDFLNAHKEYLTSRRTQKIQAYRLFFSFPLEKESIWDDLKNVKNLFSTEQQQLFVFIRQCERKWKKNRIQANFADLKKAKDASY